MLFSRRIIFILSRSSPKTKNKKFDNPNQNPRKGNSRKIFFLHPSIRIIQERTTPTIGKWKPITPSTMTQNEKKEKCFLFLLSLFLPCVQNRNKREGREREREIERETETKKRETNVQNKILEKKREKISLSNSTIIFFSSVKAWKLIIIISDHISLSLNCVLTVRLWSSTVDLLMRRSDGVDWWGVFK